MKRDLYFTGLVTLLMLVSLLESGASQVQMLTTKDVLEFPVPPADRRIPYGSSPLQFGDLRMPEGDGPFPVVVVVHGGCWLSEYNLDHVASFCVALTDVGLATWSLEYRRVGDEGGGWPGTFEDVARGVDHLRRLEKDYPLDLERVVAVGHSAGGHLVLWLAARSLLTEDSAIAGNNPLPLSGVVALAGVSDLEAAHEQNVCGDVVARFLGGTPEQVPARYRKASPVQLLPLGVRQRLVHGAHDDIVPFEMSRRYETVGMNRGDDVELIVCPDAGHFEPIAPRTFAWSLVRDAIMDLIRRD